MEETKFSNFRCPVGLLEEIDEQIKKGNYRDRSSFIVEAIEDKLHPERARERRRKQILHLLKEDPEIRSELGL